jgi:hypothetical protein
LDERDRQPGPGRWVRWQPRAWAVRRFSYGLCCCRWKPEGNGAWGRGEAFAGTGAGTRRVRCMVCSWRLRCPWVGRPARPTPVRRAPPPPQARSDGGRGRSTRRRAANPSSRAALPGRPTAGGARMAPWRSAG